MSLSYVIYTNVLLLLFYDLLSFSHPLTHTVVSVTSMEGATFLSDRELIGLSVVRTITHL